MWFRIRDSEYFFTLGPGWKNSDPGRNIDSLYVLQAVGGALNGLGGSGSLAEKMKGGGSGPPAQARNKNVFYV
jgi:hypothetical protein